MESPPTKNRKSILIELSVMLLAFVGPFLYSAARYYFNPGAIRGRTFVEIGLTSLLFYFTVLPILLYVVWINNGGLRRFGLTTWRWPLDPAIAVGTFLVHKFVLGFPQYFVSILAPGLGQESHRIFLLNRYPSPAGPAEIAFAVLLQVGNAFREEFVMRGYLITRLDDLSVRPWLTVLISALLFSSYHVYEGPLAVLTIFCLGLLYGVIFRKRRSIWPLVLAHAAWNLHLIVKL